MKLNLRSGSPIRVAEVQIGNLTFYAFCDVTKLVLQSSLKPGSFFEAQLGLVHWTEFTTQYFGEFGFGLEESALLEELTEKLGNRPPQLILLYTGVDTGLTLTTELNGCLAIDDTTENLSGKQEAASLLSVLQGQSLTNGYGNFFVRQGFLEQHPFPTLFVIFNQSGCSVELYDNPLLLWLEQSAVPFIGKLDVSHAGGTTVMLHRGELPNVEVVDDLAHNNQAVLLDTNQPSSISQLISALRTWLNKTYGC